MISVKAGVFSTFSFAACGNLAIPRLDLLPISQYLQNSVRNFHHILGLWSKREDVKSSIGRIYKKLGPV